MSQLGAVTSSISPLDAVLIEVARSAQAVEWFDELVQQLEPGDLGKHDVILKSTSQGGETYEVVWSAQNLIKMWNDQRQLLAKVATDAVRLGLAERAITIQEAQAGLLFTLVMGVLQDPLVNLSAVQLKEAQLQLAGRLRQMPVLDVESSV